jgi:hypothetical protein
VPPGCVSACAFLGSPHPFRSPNDLALSRGAASAARSISLQPPCGAVGCSGVLGAIVLKPELRDLGIVCLEPLDEQAIHHYCSSSRAFRL